MSFQHPEDRAFERIKFAEPFGHLAGPVVFDLQPLGHRALI
jgi:hypothetical protein